jgi:hypothetical protein
VNVTINYLDLNESAGNYIIISPGKWWSRTIIYLLQHNASAMIQ